MKHFFKVLVLFFLIFDLNFLVAPGLSTGKITALFLIMYVIIKGSKNAKISKGEISIYIMYIVIFIHLILLYVFNGMPDNLMITRMTYFLLYSVLMSFISGVFFEDKKEFLTIFSEAIFIQAIFVIVSWFSSEYREIISQLLVQTGNISFLSAKRPPGLMNSAGAKASVILAIGASFSLLQLTKSKKNIEIIKYTIFLITIVVAIFIVGRTGLLLFILLSGTILLSQFKDILFSQRLVLFFSVLVVLIFGVSMLIPDDFYQSILLKSDWVFSIFENGLFESDTVVDLQSQTILDLNLHTLFGTSQIRLVGGQHDSGYVQSYHAMGLIGAFMMYLTLSAHIIVLYNKKDSFLINNRLFLLALIIGLFIVEIKEPFVFSYIYPYVIFTIARLPNLNYENYKKGEFYEPKKI